ncbi:MAG: (2Fe-2S)-binding protein [Chloroflexi bacterium]|nr:(2Fe-2S)-binding protein [Chloroflexota bacterium]TDI86354.1 MAG: (2Fe-2S)-binding protein [Chloroflexota bacterium]
MRVESADVYNSAQIQIRMKVNGQSMEATIEPRELLLDFLRDRLGLTGAKRSCDVQVCGTCTVLMDGRPVSACCTLAYEAQNRELLTIEGLADGDELHPLQQSFVEQSALQCGFCTPGMILTANSLLEEIPNPTRQQIQHYLKGNLCRCTGYWSVLEAVELAARRLQAEGQSEGSA